MKFILSTVFAATIAVVTYSASAFAADKKTTVDGIEATLQKKDGVHVVVLDTKHGKNRKLRRQQAVQAATQITGCKATAVTGTVFDFQGKRERPALVQVKLKC